MAKSTSKKTREAPARKAAGGPSQREIEIRERVLRDDKFREDLIARPAETLSREYGVTAPKGWRINVHEETPGVIHLVIPGRIQPLRGALPVVESPEGGGGTSCCTCGSTTAQTLSSLQSGCGCR